MNFPIVSLFFSSLPPHSFSTCFPLSFYHNGLFQFAEVNALQRDVEVRSYAIKQMIRKRIQDRCYVRRHTEEEPERGKEEKEEADKGRAAEQASRGSAPHEIRRFARKLDVISRQLGTEHTRVRARERTHILPIHTYIRTQARVYTHLTRLPIHIRRPLINVR